MSGKERKPQRHPLEPPFGSKADKARIIKDRASVLRALADAPGPLTSGQLAGASGVRHAWLYAAHMKKHGYVTVAGHVRLADGAIAALWRITRRGEALVRRLPDAPEPRA